MFGLPSFQNLIMWVTIPIFVGLAVVNYKQTWYNVTGFIFVCINTWFIASSYITFMYDNWRAGESGNSMPTKTETHERQYLNLNTVSGNVYSQDTAKVKVNHIQLFNRTLIDQRNSNLKVDMTEGFWLKKFEGIEESRWIKIGGKGRADFLDMMERGIKFGAYKEVGGQGKRVPADWVKIRNLEKGHPLP